MTSGPTSPTLFEQCQRFFYVPLQLKYKDEGDKANGLTSPPNDAIIWTEKGVSQLAWSHQLFVIAEICPHSSKMTVDITGVTQAQSGRTTLKKFGLPANLSDYKQKYSQILLFEQVTGI